MGGHLHALAHVLDERVEALQLVVARIVRRQRHTLLGGLLERGALADPWPRGLVVLEVIAPGERREALASLVDALQVLNDPTFL